MYKSEIYRALTKLDLKQNGLVAGFLEAANVAENQLSDASAFIAGNNDQARSTGPSKVQAAIAVLMQRVKEASASDAFKELHQLSDRFDEVLENYPDLYSLVYPGKDALSILIATFNDAIAHNKSHSYVVPMVRPAVHLSSCYTHYNALKQLFYKTGNFGTSATIEIDGGDTLFEFSAHVQIISLLGEAAKKAFEHQNISGPDDQEIFIESIESGSPFKIQIGGNGKSIQMFLTMVRDVFGVVYRHTTPHGRAIQSYETVARAKELGISSPEAIKLLNEAVEVATTGWVNSLKTSNAKVFIDGRPVNNEEPVRNIPMLTKEDAAFPRLENPEKNHED